MKQERFQRETTYKLWEGEKKEKVYIKQGGKISAGQPGGNQLRASSGNIHGSLTHIPEGRAD